ncbi:MAG: hypothetical protein LBD72_02545 [Puniceicoccales bacterium]|jgi:hypothetical protein|nr:hypothetical protein [Puniceicoccales bacterium]
MVNPGPAPSAIDLPASFAALSEVKTSGFFDAFSKAIRGEIKWKDFFSCFARLKFEQTFTTTFELQDGVRRNLKSMLDELHIEVEFGHVSSKQLYDILNTKDSAGVSIAMVACLSQEGAECIIKLVGKLSWEDRDAFLKKPTGNSSPNLLDYITKNVKDGSEMQESSILAKVRQMYTHFGVLPNPGQVVASSGEKADTEVNSTYNANAERKEISTESDEDKDEPNVGGEGSDANCEGRSITEPDIETAAVARTVSLAHDTAIAELEYAILGNFDAHNDEIENFDLADIAERKYVTLKENGGNLENFQAEYPGTTNLNRRLRSQNAQRPRKLFDFIQHHHPKCPETCDPFALDTDPNASVYQTQAAALGKEFGDDFLERELSCAIPQHFQADCSRIVHGGDRTTCVSASPLQCGKAEVFLRALALELGNDESGLIIAIEKSNYFKDGTGGLSNVKTIAGIKLPNGMEVVIHKGEISGKDKEKKMMYQMSIPGWADNSALPDEIMLALNMEIEKFCAEHGIKVVDMHCAGGLGRAPTLCVCNAITRVARVARENGLSCCCNWARQTERVVDGQVNLAYVARNMVLKGAATRSTFGQVGDQFKSYKSYADAVANEYHSVPGAA